jgi:peroxin-5
MMQHQHHMLMMQHQQMMMMQQHHHMMMQHQERQKNQQQMPVEIPLKSETTAETTNLDDWHKGLEDDLPQGITMDELAAAWAQAEAEYDAEVAVNMASVYHNDDVERPYTFTQAPPDKESVKTNWMKMGLEEYQRGNIKEAIRAFETQVQLQDDHSKAWYYLGKCHAENDQDVQAIACLERSVERDPFSPSTLLALGVSHVNELNHTKALQNLKEWITHNPEYAGLSVENDLYGAAKGESSELEQVQGLLLRALEHEPTPEVHEALGVVYNVSRDYDAAVASFRRALESRPQDYSLWNKLGATLANSNASSEALPAYSQALALRPKYARGWLNLAISHSNLHNYNEAARCYLQTLALNPDATHCWAYLRIALSCQEQWDLLPLVSAQDLSAFQEHYDFVLDKSLLKYG